MNDTLIQEQAAAALLSAMTRQLDAAMAPSLNPAKEVAYASAADILLRLRAHIDRLAGESNETIEAAPGVYFYALSRVNDAITDMLNTPVS